MKIRIITLLIIICQLNPGKAQNTYVLEINPPSWSLPSSYYYIDSIIDERISKENAGNILHQGKQTIAVFKESLIESLENLINTALPKDSAKESITLGIKRFELKETGNISNHKLVLNYAFAFYKIRQSRSFLLYEINGKPEITMRGPYSNPYDKIIQESVKNSLRNFDDWLRQNSSIPPLAKSVEVIINRKIDYPPSSGSDTIQWTENYKLKWSDFKGKTGNTGFMAESNCIFNYKAEPEVKDKKIKLSITLNACFAKNTSWVKSDQQKEALLAHEQLHFDICELHIRKLRKKVSETQLDPINFSTQINEMFTEAWNDYMKHQELYDSETEHGIVFSKQENWVKNIGVQLAELEMWK